MSTSVKIIKIILLINNFNEIIIAKYVTKFKDDYWLKYKDFLNFLSDNKIIGKLISNLPSFLIDDVLLSTEEKQDFMKQFEESNSQVARKYLGRKDGILFDNNI